MIHVWKKNSHYRSYRYKWETSQKRKLVGRMHSVGRVLSFIFSRQNCFFPTPHPQSNVSRAKGKRGRDTFASEWGGGSYWKRLSFDEGIYTVVLYFYMYYVLIWAKRENRRWGWMIMIHVPRHHNIEVIAKYRWLSLCSLWGLRGMTSCSPPHTDSLVCTIKKKRIISCYVHSL